MIFCVEDDNNIRDLLVYTLETTGFHARGLEDSQELWKALAEEEPELILLDIMLPGEDGYSILEKLKKSSGTRDIPIIMVTAKEAEFDKVRALEAGAEDMITHDDSYEIQTAPENYTAVHGALTDAGYEMVDSDVEFVPSMESAPKDAHDLKQLKKMIDILEDNDDVQKVHHNCRVDLEEVE